MQSPIPVYKDSVIVRNYTPFYFSNYGERFDSLITYHEEGIVLDLWPWPETKAPSVSGGGLFHKYVLVSIAFRWDSEHVINDKRYPLEVQLVHCAKKYGRHESVNYKDGIAIFSVFYELSKKRNSAIEKLLDSIPPVQMKISKGVELRRHVIPWNFLPSKLCKFYRYNGSITKPCYDEIAIWTLLSTPAHITQLQLDRLRNNWNTLFKNKTTNCRELQDVNKRRVYLSAI